MVTNLQQKFKIIICQIFQHKKNYSKIWTRYFWNLLLSSEKYFLLIQSASNIRILNLYSCNFIINLYFPQTPLQFQATITCFTPSVIYRKQRKLIEFQCGIWFKRETNPKLLIQTLPRNDTKHLLWTFEFAISHRQTHWHIFPLQFSNQLQINIFFASPEHKRNAPRAWKEPDNQPTLEGAKDLLLILKNLSIYQLTRSEGKWQETLMTIGNLNMNSTFALDWSLSLAEIQIISSDFSNSKIT